MELRFLIFFLVLILAKSQHGEDSSLYLLVKIESNKNDVHNMQDIQTFPLYKNEHAPSSKKQLKTYREAKGLSTYTTDTLGYTKVVVALGESMDEIEVIDLSSSDTQCKNMQNFIDKYTWPIGGLGFGNKPMICQALESSCHSLQDGKWTTEASLTEGRYASAMTTSPFLDDGSKLFVTGGKVGYSRTRSTEVLTEDGWKLSIPLPVEISHHCIVKINSTSLMVIGGRQGISGHKTSGKTFILNGDTKVWMNGPDLKMPREDHSCIRILKDSQSQDKSVIAVGGYGGDDNILNSTEVFDVGSSEWRKGPDLPFAIADAAIVEDPSGGAVLIGGLNVDKGHLETIFRLPNAESSATWEEMTQKLKFGRAYHVAFLIPDEFTDCN